MKPADSYLSPEELVGEEWAEWYLLTPIERWQQSSILWQTYLTLGCSLETEPDTQSPFFDGSAPGSVSAYGRRLRKNVRRHGDSILCSRE
jgi:hypothetical protein